MEWNLTTPKVCGAFGICLAVKKIHTQYCSLQCSQRASKLRKREELIKSTIDKEAEKFGISNTVAQESDKIQDSSTSLNNKQFLSVAEAAVLLGVCRATINNYCVQGKLNCLKMNRQIFIR